MAKVLKTVFFLLAVFLQPLSAETVDRILAVAGDRVISWSGALAEANYQALRGGQEPPRWGLPEAAHSEPVQQVVSRMVDQALLEQARDRSPFRVPESEEIQGQLQEIQKQFAGAAAYREALARHQLTEAELLERLARESRLLAFIDFTLRPRVRITSEQVEAYYRDTLLPDLQRRPGEANAPPLSEVRGQIEELLVQQEINRLLEGWLEQLRRTTTVQIWTP